MQGQTVQLGREHEIGFPVQYGPTRSDKKPGHALMPHEVYRDFVVIFLMTGIILVLTGLAVPELGPPAGGAARRDALPDWYLLWTFGLVIVAGILPEITLGPIVLEADLWGFLLTNIPLILLLILPFIDKGFESRPAKSNVRAAVGVAFLVWVTAASVFAISGLILPFFVTSLGRLLTIETLRWMFLVEPFLAGLATYIALRRLAFKPMRRINTAFNAGALALLVGITVYLLLGLNLANGSSLPSLLTVENLWLGLYIGIALATAIVALYIVYFLDEARSRRTLFSWIGLILLILVPVSYYLMTFQQPIFDYVQIYIMTNSHTFVALPIFGILVTYFGQRTPYSDYEFKLNECYQCGRCHLVCPITKVDADALGGLNLVYNVYKRQHDGVPMWACLTCDACSAVCPVDINYSDYVLTERARIMKERRRIPERPAATTRTAPDGGRRS